MRDAPAPRTITLDDVDKQLAELAERELAIRALDTIPGVVNETVIADPEETRCRSQGKHTGTAVRGRSRASEPVGCSRMFAARTVRPPDRKESSWLISPPTRPFSTCWRR